MKEVAEEKSKDVSSIAAGLIGAAVGAAVAVGSIALADKKNRQKLQKFASEVKDKGEDLLKLIQRETMPKEEKAVMGGKNEQSSSSNETKVSSSNKQIKIKLRKSQKTKK